MNTSLLKVILFDLDGTLVHTAPDVHIAINKALLQMQLPQLSYDNALKAIGPGPDSFINIILGQVNEHRLEEFLSIFRPIYFDMCVEKSQPFPGIVEVLEELHKSYKLAIVTNKGLRTTHKVIDELKLRRYFDLIVGPDLVGKVKPAPDMVLLALDHFGVKAEEALLIGDTDNDVLAAQAANVPVAAVTWGYVEASFLGTLGPQFIIHTPDEILDLVKYDPISGVR